MGKKKKKKATEYLVQIAFLSKKPYSLKRHEKLQRLVDSTAVLQAIIKTGKIKGRIVLN
jgi:hypothetical protein